MSNHGKKNWLWRALRFSGLFLREGIGWALMLLGLNVFRISFQYLNFAAVIEGFIAAVIGFTVFRSGLQLVKVSVAARALRAEQLSRFAAVEREVSPSSPRDVSTAAGQYSRDYSHV